MSGLPGTADWVYSLTSWDPDGPGPATPELVVGGKFSAAGGIYANQIASFDPATGRVSTFGRGLGGPTDPSLVRGVYALATLPNGDLVAGGNFSFSGPTSVRYIARWDGASWRPLGSGMDAPVSALCVAPNGDLIAGGYFTVAGGVQASRVARWDGSAWHPLGAGTSDPVRAVTTLPNGDVVAGGSFQSAGGTAANHIARWDGSAWHPLGTGTSEMVLALSVAPNGDLLAGGSFATAGGVASRGIARWNGSSWSGFGTGVDGLSWVYATMVLPNGDLVIGGFFSAVNGVAANRVARWDGANWSAMGNGFPVFGVLALAAPLAGGLFAGGSIRQNGSGIQALHLARWDGLGWKSPTVGIDAPVTSLVARADGGLLAGGRFNTVVGVGAPRIAAWDGNSWSALGSSSPAGWDGNVLAVGEFANGDVLVGGWFTRAAGVAATNVARWDGVAWHPLGPGVTGPPGAAVAACLVHSSGDVYVGGTISNGIARWDGVAWHDLGLPTGGSSTSVSALLELPNGDVVAGGLFATIGGTTADNVARWDGSSWHPFGAGIGGPLYALARLPNGDVVAGGGFTNVNGGTSANRIARWDGTAWSPLGTGFDAAVRAIEVLPNGDLVVGGDFTMAGSAPANRLARWDGASWSAIATIGLATNVAALAYRRDGGLAIAGYFSLLGAAGPFLSEWRSTCPGTAVPIPTACTGSTGPLALSASSLPWVGSTFESAAAGFAPGALGASVVGLSSANVPLSVWTPFAGPGCSQLASYESIRFVVPQAGTASDTVSIPNSSAYIGLVLFHQFLQLEPWGPLQPPLVSSSNGLRLTVGVF